MMQHTHAWNLCNFINQRYHNKVNKKERGKSFQKKEKYTKAPIIYSKSVRENPAILDVKVSS